MSWIDPPHMVEVSTFDAPSGPLAIFRAGPADGTPVCLIPGITGSKEDFSLVIPHLADSGYFVTAVDPAGQYQSASAGPRPGSEWSLDLHIQDALALLEDSGPAHLVGYSYGGLVTSHIVVSRPEMLLSATFLGTPPVSGNAFRSMRLVGPLIGNASPELAARIMVTGIKWNLNLVDGDRLNFVRHRLRYTVQDSVVGAMADMLELPDLADQLRSSPVPRMVCVGRGDLWSLRRHREFARRIGAQLRTYNAGHAPSEETPDELAADLLSFYRSIGDDPLYGGESEHPLAS